MSLTLSEKNKTEVVNIALTICARDGILSGTELSTLREKFPEYFKVKIEEKDFEAMVDDFFQSDKQIEAYLEPITDQELRRSVLIISMESAASDGLDIRENIAFEKAMMIWGFELKDLRRG